MTNALPVHIYFALDRSGSMEPLRGAVVEGFNSFLTEQKWKPGKCRLTMIQFDTGGPHDVLHDATKLADVPLLAIEDFVTRGGTPLFDAEGWLMDRGQARSREREANGKPAEAVLFVTMTDGQENSSTDWDVERVKAKKEELEAVSGWVFTYLGLGSPRVHFAQAGQSGVVAASSVANAPTAAGMAETYGTLGYAVTNVRSNAHQGHRTAASDLYAGREETNTASKA